MLGERNADWLVQTANHLKRFPAKNLLKEAKGAEGFEPSVKKDDVGCKPRSSIGAGWISFKEIVAR